MDFNSSIIGIFNSLIICEFLNMFATMRILDSDETDKIDIRFFIIEGEFHQSPDRLDRSHPVQIQASFGGSDTAVGALQDGIEKPFLTAEIIINHSFCRVRARRNGVNARTRQTIV